MFSFSEMIFLGILAFIVIGPKQLPELARKLGRILNELKRASDPIKHELGLNFQNQNPPPPSVKPKPAEVATPSVTAPPPRSEDV
jgi:Sec-independent protein translocase protein TatA